MADNSRRPNFVGVRLGSGLFIGLLLTALGTILLLDQQGIIEGHKVYRFLWPSILIFFGLENLLCRTGRHHFFGAALVLIGAVILLGDLGYVPFHVGWWNIWPIVLIALGIKLVFRRFSERGGIVAGSPSPFTGRGDAMGSASLGNLDAPSFRYLALLSGVKQRIISKNFRSGSVTAVWGGFDIDLTQADLEGGTAVLDINAFMGGGKIRVPNNWTVDMQGTPVMGGLVDEREQIPTADGSAARRLIIRGIVFMGGVVIKD
jgi:predicted membrane protein